MAQQSRSKNKVFIVNSNPQITDMFRSEGWEVVDEVCNANLIQFTGGWDVDPKMYGEERHPSTVPFPARDKKESLIYILGRSLNIPMAGICRGGQFLNVMCGGKLWQDVDKHSLKDGTHTAYDGRTGETFQVTSTHHQMMIPKAGAASIIVYAKQSTMYEKMAGKPGHKSFTIPKTSDIEALFYEKEKCFCFQPHPEVPKHRALARRYFDYLEDLLRVGKFV